MSTTTDPVRFRSSTPVPERSQKSPLRRTIGAARGHLHGQGLLMAGGGTALLAEVVFRVLEPWPLKFVIDAVTRSLGADLSTPGPFASWRLLILCGIATVVIVGMRALCNYLATVAFALAGSRVATRMRRAVFEHTQALSDSFHNRTRTGDTVQRLVGDVGRLQEVLVTAGLPLLANVVTMIAMAGVMFWLDPLLALVVVIAAILFLLTSRTSSPKITQASRKTRKGEGQLANTAQESLGSMRVIQAYGLEKVMADQFASANLASLKNGVQARRLAAALERTTDVVVGLATATVIVLGGWRVMTGKMTPGDLVIFTTYLKTAMKPLRDLAKYTGRIARAAASGERVADLLDERVDIADPPDPVPLDRARGDLRLADLTVGYEGSVVLKHLDLHIPAGQRVAIVGPSGGGKSTLASMALRLRDPLAGAVLLDDVDLRRYRICDVRRNVSIVLQDSVLFTGTLRENIRHGRPEATDEEVDAAARAAQLDRYLAEQPDGLDTMVGERGSTLSGGQRQRVAIARAMLRDAPIVVLDEAMAGLDPANAGRVREAIEVLTHGRTTISITHDAPSALASDRVLWVENQRILLDGTPQELLAEPDGKFRTWVQQQRAASDVDAFSARQGERS